MAESCKMTWFWTYNMIRCIIFDTRISQSRHLWSQQHMKIKTAFGSWIRVMWFWTSSEELPFHGAHWNLEYTVFYIKQTEQNAGTLNEKMQEAGPGIGMHFGNYNAVMTQSARIEVWAWAIKKTQRRMNGSLKLCICVLPDNRADRYTQFRRSQNNLRIAK